MGVSGVECLQLHTVYKKPNFLLQVSELQVMQESVSGTTSHMCVSECTMKLKVHVIKSLSPQYQATLEKLVIFSSIVLYCGDTYIITELSVVVFVLLNAINWDHSLMDC